MKPEGHPRFITVEGGDGAGKTTQLALLCDYLQQHGVPYELVREPGGTPAGEAVRNILLQPGRTMHVMTEALLYAASRAELVRTVIRPALDAGRVVICDRYVDSSLAYQGIAGGLGLEPVRAINQFATDGLEPGLTILLDLSAAEAGRRRGRRRADRMEGKGAVFLEQVQHGYRMLAEAEPARIRVIDAGRSVAAVQADIQAVVSEWLGLSGR